MKTSISIAIAVATLTFACSTPENRLHPFSQGWRNGEIKMLGSATSSFPVGAIDCRGSQAHKEPIDQVYAYVQFDFRSSGKYFGSNPKQRHIISRVMPGVRIAKGDHVRVNLKDCSQAVAPQKSQS